MTMTLMMNFYLLKMETEKNKIIGDEQNISIFLDFLQGGRYNFYVLRKLPLLNPTLIYKVWNSGTLYPILINNRYDFSLYSKLAIMDLKSDYYLKIENKNIYEYSPKQEFTNLNDLKNYELTKNVSFTKNKKFSFIFENSKSIEKNLEHNLLPDDEYFIKIVIITNKQGSKDVLLYIAGNPNFTNLKLYFKKHSNKRYIY